MAKPTTMPKAKKAKKTKPRKPQPLPRSVQALLKYLGGSDVKLGGARGGQPATLAPTSINIAVSQQQQQTQAQQSVRARVAPKGQVIGQSPLGAVIPQQPVIVQQAPASSAETERKIQEQAKQAEVKQNELNRKFGLLEADQQQFRQAAATAYQDIKQDINRRVTGDANIFDARNIAARFSTTTPRPVVEEQQFAGMSFGGGGEAEGIVVTEVFRGARQEERVAGLGEFLGGQYIQNVSNPEMTDIKRPGRPRKSDAEKAATKAAAAARKKASKPTAAEASSSASLLEQRAPATIAGFTAVPEQGYMLKEPARRTILVKKKPVSTTGAPDMAAQIAMLTGGGAALPPQSQGRTVADLLGAKRK